MTHVYRLLQSDRLEHIAKNQELSVSNVVVISCREKIMLVGFATGLVGRREVGVEPGEINGCLFWKTV